MILPAARVRKWMMAGLPFAALAGVLWRAGGAAAVALWMGLGVLLLKRHARQYPKQRRLGLSRLFFACASGCAAMAALSFFARRAFAPSGGLADQALLSFGCACFSLTACEKALSRPLPRKLAWALGSALCAFFFAFLFF